MNPMELAKAVEDERVRESRFASRSPTTCRVRRLTLSRRTSTSTRLTNSSSTRTIARKLYDGSSGWRRHIHHPASFEGSRRYS